MSYYEILKDIGAFSGLGWLLKTAFSAFARRLSQRERELLAAALTMDQYFVWFFNIPNAGHIWVRAGKLDLGNSRVPNADFVDAFESLIRRGYLRHSQGDLYVLSGTGLKVAKKCALRIPLAQIPCEQNESSQHSRSSLPGPGAMVG